MMEKKVLLLVGAAIFVGLYFYGDKINKDSDFMK